MATIKLVKTESHDPDYGISEYDVLVDGVEVGTVIKGGGYSMTYYPWRAGRQNWATRKEAVDFIVRRHTEKAS